MNRVSIIKSVQIMAVAMMMIFALTADGWAQGPGGGGGGSSKPAKSESGGTGSSMWGIGMSLPSGDLGDLWKTGFHLIGGRSYPVGPTMDMTLDSDFHYFPLDAGSADIEGGAFFTVMMSANVRQNFGVDRKVSNPFVFGGLGLSVYKATDMTVTVWDPYYGNMYEMTIQFDTEIKPYLQFGGGMDFGNLTLQAKMVNIIGADSDFGVSFISLSFGFRS